MEIIRDILLEFGLLLVITLSLVGAAASIMLIVWPGSIRNISDRLNRYVDVDHRLAFLDREIPTNRFIYRHHRIAGAFFIAGGGLLLFCLFLCLDQDRLQRLWLTSSLYITLDQIVVSVMIVLGQVGGVLGLMLGILLVVDPGRLQLLESRMETSVSFQPAVDRLNAFHGDLDAVLLRHPLIFGACGLLASVLLALVAYSGLQH